VSAGLSPNGAVEKDIFKRKVRKVGAKHSKLNNVLKLFAIFAEKLGDLCG
jgi:hypothetical protein